jgi:hypothetical protein
MTEILRRLAHALFRVHVFAACTVIDAFDNKYAGECCRFCGVVREDRWQYLGPRVRPR